GRRMDPEMLGGKKENSDPIRIHGNINTQKLTMPVGASDCSKKKRMQLTQGNDGGVGASKGSLSEEMRVGDIVVKIGERKEAVERIKGQMKEVGSNTRISTVPDVATKENERQVLMRSYRAQSDDVTWAQNVLVATIITGEAVPVVQNRITDACFDNMVLIPMGADKVFVRSSAREDVSVLVNNAKDFFNIIFSKWMRSLRADSCSADKDRLDVARVLIATPDLEIFNTVVSIKVDGTLVQVKVVEEWGTLLVRILVFLRRRASDIQVNVEGINAEVDPLIPMQSKKDGVSSPGPGSDHVERSVTRVLERGGSPLMVDTPESISICSPAEEVDRLTGSRRQVDLNHGEAWVIFFARKQFPRRVRVAAKQKKVGHKDTTRNRAGGVFRHTHLSLKKVARLPSKDRSEVLRILKKTEHRRRASEQVVVDDVMEVWKAIGVTLKGDTTNMFSALTRPGNSNKMVPGQSQGGGVLDEDYLLEYSAVGGDREDAGGSGECLCALRLWGEASFVGLAFYKNSNAGEVKVVLYGDFITVRSLEERRSVRDKFRSLDHIAFNRFIDDNYLIDLPLCGRKFTWFKGDGLTMSRLDRFLLSGEWCLTWPNCTQVARMRGLSDHSLVLTVYEEDWGPRPSRMLKCWKDVPGIKLALKDWYQSHKQNLPSRSESLKDRFAALDEKGEEVDLEEDERAEIHGITSDIHSLSRLHASICWQQSRSRWMKEGDANTKFFHSALASRRRGNTISSLQVDGMGWREDHLSDRWQWLPDLGNCYTVRGAYQLLTARYVVPLDVAAGLIWHPQDPLKVPILAWRLLRDRLPTKVNMINRGILPAATHFCVSGCGAAKTAQHLFLSCSTFGSLLASVSSWIGSSLVKLQTLSDHFVQFTSSACGARACRSFMQLIWFACVWVVWTERNH
ncbi:hypothetical protein TSUD_406570, partial [Trifolium subterraneum]